METITTIEDFHGVYLLCSQSSEKKYRNRCYVGYTVNPSRRINQHNRGRDFGGAKRTNNRGPWKMVMIIHGFPNNISALRFEWAWQYPKTSCRLKMYSELEKKKPNESHFDYNFRILTEMLRIGPWNRLPLIIRWLAPEYVKEFPPDKLPPLHMQICHGHVSIKKKLISDMIENSQQQQNKLETDVMPPTRSQTSLLECHLCMRTIDNITRSKIGCINPKCQLTCHIICLSEYCLNEPGEYIPIEGDCPICQTHFLWGDLIRKRNGCNDLEDVLTDENDDDSEDCTNDGNQFPVKDEEKMNIFDNLHNENVCINISSESETE